jgi:hypothetical protein
MTRAAGTIRSVGVFALVVAVAGGAFKGDGVRPGAPAVVSTVPVTTGLPIVPALRPVLRPPPPPPPFVEIHARMRERRIAEQAIAILRRHGELATRRHGPVWRPNPDQVKQLSVTVCDFCAGPLGTARIETYWVYYRGTPWHFEIKTCAVLLNMRSIRAEARAWGLPVTLVMAGTLVHEQEHCLRDPDRRERPAVDAEVRFARKLGNARLIEMALSDYDCLDRRGYWKEDC